MYTHSKLLSPIKLETCLSYFERLCEVSVHDAFPVSLPGVVLPALPIAERGAGCNVLAREHNRKGLLFK